MNMVKVWGDDNLGLLTVCDRYTIEHILGKRKINKKLFQDYIPVQD